MAKQVTYTATYSVQGDGVNENDVMVGPFILPNSPAERVPVGLNSGNNTILLPSSPNPTCTFVEIIPPANSSNAKYVKLSNSETGIRMNNSFPYRLSVDPSMTQFVINSAGPESVTIVIG